MNNKTIVHLGSGKCNELDEYLASDAKKVILVEANPSIVTSLQKKVGDSKRIEILDLAVFDQINGQLNMFNLINASSDLTKRQLNVFNLIGASSLHAPTGLTNLFPGLQTVRLIEVKVKSSVDIVNALQLHENENNVLVIDTPGEEFNILKNLAENKLLQLFSQIKLHCGVSSLYQGSKSSNEILEYLSGFEYNMVYQDDEIDPDRPCWTLQLNTLALENRVLKEEFNQLKQEKMSLQTAYQDKLSTLTLERDTQVKSTNDKLFKISQLTKGRGELSSIIEDQKQQIEQITKVKDEQGAVVKDRQKKIEQLSKSFDQQKKQLNDTQVGQKVIEEQHDVLAKELGKTKETEVQLKKDLAEARQTTSLSIKLQTLKEADLRDLQKKYSEALIVQDNQYQLLAKLSERLSLASKYFHQMSENQSVITEERKISVQEKSQSPRPIKKRQVRRRRK